ncbi:MAG TPA: hypothetical protein VFS21_22385 [Roseiflexaceae bacterium]|nr:hypothetical protein [Roseiflexaceae bacterium]
MTASLLERLEADIEQLSLTDQLWLMERLAHHIRRLAGSSLTAQEHDLSAMAQDPAMQRELRQINQEFAEAEEDGLGAML